MEEPRRVGKGPNVLKSLSFSTILAFLELKEIIKAQAVSRFVYNIGLPRSLYIAPIIFKQPFAIEPSRKSILIYNAETGLSTRHPLPPTEPPLSMNATQMPNGRIFMVLAFQAKRTQVFEISKRSWILDLRFESRKHSFVQGAVASSVMGRLYISGTKEGKTKAVARIDLSEK